ncbi:MAG: hypothetical protein VX447_16345 [Pseudomonadota bacterium]|uniref:hypothetical protein n=1 Tax=Gallaecimonas pentaromativorans TaxID=584787 RepID=UPI00067EBF97|nr:hypothetical protein [Gallaecimonas pentaromativorans]MED5526306.1 hypothetical protein [Pseudomonadota bacterium]
MRKVTLIAVALLAAPAFATETQYQLLQDNLVDGTVDATSAQPLSLPLQIQNRAFAYTDTTSVLKGEFIQQQALIRFSISKEDGTAYYQGKKTQGNNYQGNWYDNQGNSGDFSLVTDEGQNGGDCNAATGTGWFNGYYCNAEIEGGGWQLVAVRNTFDPREAVDQITAIDGNQYLTDEKWAAIRNQSSEILFVQPDKGFWGIMTIADASDPRLCKPLTTNLGDDVLVHSEDNECGYSGNDYTMVGNPNYPTYQGSFYNDAKILPLWGQKNFSWSYSQTLMVFVR